MATPEAFVPVAVTDRNGLDESVHFGAVVVLGPSGDVAYSAGDPAVVVYPRSSNKPMQALAMVRAGLVLPPRLLALVCASHDGTPMHTAAATEILGSAGLTPADLANTPAMPVDQSAANDVIRAGGGKSSLLMNCSGKHAGMLATCVVNGWAHDERYLDEDHPLQRAITDVVDELCDEPHAHIGIDGCGAPAHAMSLLGLARAFRSIADGSAGPAAGQIHDAMTQHPEMVGGERRDVTRFMREVPGLMAKDGADGVFAGAFPDGRAFAVKIADGGERAVPVVVLAALEHLGVPVDDFASGVTTPIYGHGKPVGRVRSLLP